MTGLEALAQAVPKLRKAGVEDPMGDARRLLTFVMGLGAGRLSLHLSDQLTEGQVSSFQGAVKHREARVPVSHLIGGRWFFDRWFLITANVLDPRPDTETLVFEALRAPFTSVLDLGTGSGCILLTLLSESPLSKGLGTDISVKALEVAKQNAKAFKLQDRVSLLCSDWFQNVQGQFDLIVSNPPYITADEMKGLAPEVGEHEPHIALTPGGDGLDSYRQITRDASDYLTKGGRLMVEIGPKQAMAVSTMFRNAGFENVVVCQDLDGRDRVIQGRKPL